MFESTPNNFWQWVFGLSSCVSLIISIFSLILIINLKRNLTKKEGLQKIINQMDNLLKVLINPNVATDRKIEIINNLNDSKKYLFPIITYFKDRRLRSLIKETVKMLNSSECDYKSVKNKIDLIISELKKFVI